MMVLKPPLPTSSNPPNTITFQDGIAPIEGYRGTLDTYLSESAPDTNYGSEINCRVDGDEPSSTGLDLSTLIRRDISQIPTTSEVLCLRCH